MNFVDVVKSYGITMPMGAPPVVVAHPNYGLLGHCVPGRGLVPPKNRWASTRAILRDSNRKTIKFLQKFEDLAPKFAVSAAAAWMAKDITALPFLMGAITNYDGIVAARGNNTFQDYWMYLTASMTPVNGAWHDTWKMAWSPGSVPSVTAYTNAGTGGAVMTAASNGSWIANPAGTNKRYIVSCGLSTTSISGAVLAMLVDNLWAGSLTIVNNTTTNPSTDVATTRYTGTDAAGNMLLNVLTATLTYSAGPPTITVTYTNQAGSTGKTLISLAPATGPLTNRVIYNTLHNSATVVGCTPFMPLTNGGDAGVRNLEQIAYATGLTITSGAVDHKIVRPLIVMPFIAANSFIEQDATLNIGNMVELANASQVCGCLGWVILAGGTTAFTFSAFLRTVEG